MADPYLGSNGRVLRNLLNIDDPDRFAVVETKLASARDAELAVRTLPGQYDLSHFQGFHRFLFRDVYDWAGELRQVDISRPGSRFCNWKFLQDEMTSVLYRLNAEEWLSGIRRDKFVERLAWYYGEINARHPFREGNGRAQRAFLRQLAASAGWRLDWTELSAQENIEASRHNLLSADTSKLVAVLEPVVHRM